MPGSESYFLRFNQDEIFRDLLAIEGHFRYVTPEKDSGDLSCVLKHLGLIESHALEGISHALVAKDEETSQKFAELKDKAYELRTKIQNGRVSASEGIRTIRKIRGFFESFNPDYDISHCTTCGPIEQTYQIERSLRTLKGNPGGNLVESQRFKREKHLNYRHKDSQVVKINMAKGKDVLGIYGSELIAKAATIGFVEIDKAAGKAVAPLHERPSVWMNIGLGIGIPLITLWRKVKDPIAIPLIAAGGNLFSKVVDYLAEAISPPVTVAAARVTYGKAAVVTTPGTVTAFAPASVSANQRVHTRLPSPRVSVGPSYSYSVYRGP